MRHCVSLCFIVLFMFLCNIVSGQLALLLLINDDNDDNNNNDDDYDIIIIIIIVIIIKIHMHVNNHIDSNQQLLMRRLWSSYPSFLIVLYFSCQTAR